MISRKKTMIINVSMILVIISIISLFTAQSLTGKVISADSSYTFAGTAIISGLLISSLLVISTKKFVKGGLIALLSASLLGGTMKLLEYNLRDQPSDTIHPIEYYQSNWDTNNKVFIPEQGNRRTHYVVKSDGKEVLSTFYKLKDGRVFMRDMDTTNLVLPQGENRSFHLYELPRSFKFEELNKKPETKELISKSIAEYKYCATQGATEHNGRGYNVLLFEKVNTSKNNK